MRHLPVSIVARNSVIAALIFGCFVATFVVIQQRSVTGQLKQETRELARIEYTDGVVSGTVERNWSSGVTFASLTPGSSKMTKFVLSIAADPNSPDAKILKVFAVDKNGNDVEIEQSSASATGTKHSVITFVCAAKLSTEKMGEVIVKELPVP